MAISRLFKITQRALGDSKESIPALQPIAYLQDPVLLILSY